MGKRKRFGLVLSPNERNALLELAEAEGEISSAAVIRKLINQYIRQRKALIGEISRMKEANAK